MPHKAFWFIFILLIGCDESEDKSDCSPVVVHSNIKREPSAKEYTSEKISCSQDLNKPYTLPDKPWVLAKPLNIFNDSNISKSFE